MNRHWISQLAHVEILSPKPEESLWFFKELLGLEESGREGQSVYLRGWGEFFHHSVKLTEADEAGMAHLAWRSDGPEALEEAVQFLETTEFGEGWQEPETGQGPSYRFRTPGGHVCELFWEVEWFQTPEDLKTPIKCRPQKYLGRGAAVRRIDHMNLYAPDVPPCREFFQELGFRHHEGIFDDESDFEIGAWLATTNLSHDIAFVADPTGVPGRLNHVAFFQETREEVMRTADIMRDQGIFIECGPSRHALSEAFFVYFYEPGGNRVEVYSGSYLNFAPDWGPVKWTLSDAPGMYWSGDLPQSNFTYGTPPVPSEAGSS